MVLAPGIEPGTYWLQVSCSTNWATPAINIWDQLLCWSQSLIKILAMTYFHMGKPHTIIGARLFHFWVRDGIRWVQTAMVARKNGFYYKSILLLAIRLIDHSLTVVVRISMICNIYGRYRGFLFTHAFIFLKPKLTQVIWSRQSAN